MKRRIEREKRAPNEFENQSPHTKHHLQSKQTTTMVWTLKQQKVIAIVPRIAASISFVSALFIVISILRDRMKRSRIYHRIMVGISINVMILMIMQFWGTTAVPVDTVGVYGAKGNITTCSIQGFMNQVFGWAVLCYYAALSIWSLVAIRSHFKIENIARYCEPMIHIGVYIFPVSTAIYILYREGFNFSGHTCWIASSPYGCGYESSLNTASQECERGPSNPQEFHWFAIYLPFATVFLGPTVLMIIMYVMVRIDQTSYPNIRPTVVARQALLYLGALYWTYLPAAIATFMIGHPFSISLFITCWEVLLGFWIFLVYIYFNKLSDDGMKIDEATAAAAAAARGANNHSDGNNNNNNNSSDDGNRTKKFASVTAGMEDDSSNDDDVEVGNNNDNNDRRKMIRRSSLSSSSRCSSSEHEIVFSIFDGTNKSCNSEWSQYIFDGDKEDECNDESETCHWEDTIQR